MANNPSENLVHISNYTEDSDSFEIGERLAKEGSVPLIESPSKAQHQFDVDELIYLSEKRKERKIQQRNYRKIKCRKELNFKTEDFFFIEAEAKRQGFPFSTFNIECTLAYLKQYFLLPRTAPFLKLDLKISKLSNYLNQMARNGNKSGEISKGEFEEAKQEITDMAKLVQNAVERPKNLLEILEEEYNQNPHIIEHLQAFIVSKHDPKIYQTSRTKF